MGLQFLYLVAVLYCWYDRGWAENQTEYDLSDYKIWWVGRNLEEDVNNQRIRGGAEASYIHCDFPHGQQYWPHPSNCQMYVQCGPSGPVERGCPPGTAWSQPLQTCDHLQYTDCVPSKQQGPGSCHYWCNNDLGEPYCCEPAHTKRISNPSDICEDYGYCYFPEVASLCLTSEYLQKNCKKTCGLCNKTSRLGKSCRPCEFYANGMFPHPTDCRRYIECSDNSYHDRACAPGSTYNPEKAECGWHREYPCVTKSFYNADGSCHYEDEIKKECGIVKPRPRIEGGFSTAPHQYPWMVTFTDRKPEPKPWPYCGGSLINRKWILTAAHCFYYGPYPLTIDTAIVILGHHNLWKAKKTKKYKPKRIIKHRLYSDEDSVEDYGKFTNDIALVELYKPAQYNDAISPVCLPEIGEKYNYNKKDAIVIGYGEIKEKSGIRPNVLTALKLTTLSNKDCKDIKNDKMVNDYQNISETQLCAGGSAGRSVCSGDSGGPLMTLREGNLWKTKQYVQIGIVSGIQKCGIKDKPAVFTKVEDFVPWIKQNINGGCYKAKVFTRNNKDKTCY